MAKKKRKPEQKHKHMGRFVIGNMDMMIHYIFLLSIT